MTRESSHHAMPVDAPRIAVLGGATLQMLGVGFMDNDSFHGRLRAGIPATSEQESDNLAAADVLVRIPELISLETNPELTDGLPADPAPDNEYVPALITTLTEVGMYTTSGEPSAALKKVKPFLRLIYPALPFHDRLTIGEAEASLPWPEDSTFCNSYQHLKRVALEFIRSLPKITFEVTHSNDMYSRPTSDALNPAATSLLGVNPTGIRMPGPFRGAGHKIQTGYYAGLYTTNAAQYLTSLLGHVESLNNQLISKS